VTRLDEAPRCVALVPCAGVGARAGSRTPKQYQPLTADGRTVVGHTLATLTDPVLALHAVCVIVAPHDTAFARAAPTFANAAPGSSPAANQHVWAVGGATRAESVRNGLQRLLQKTEHTAPMFRPQDWVLVHDAARCVVAVADIARVISACQPDAVGGLLAQPLADTLKQADAAGRVASTPSRADKWLAQTPQMFRAGPLLAAYEQAGDSATDEASAMEAAGFAPLLVAAQSPNFKITWPSDFALARAVLAERATPND
jgi:2-C-methyl-D-erythritol 4-phosphate cytidylyltransferase